MRAQREIFERARANTSSSEKKFVRKPRPEERLGDARRLEMFERGGKRGKSEQLTEDLERLGTFSGVL